MSKKSILILGLGNDIIADDAIGVLAARELLPRLEDTADVIESSEAGMALLELMEGYKRAVIIDAIKTGSYDPGSIIPLKPEDLGTVSAPTAHYAGIPEIIAMAKMMQIDFPSTIEIFAIEVEDPFTIGGEMTHAVKQVLPVLVERVETYVKSLKNQ